MNPAVLLIDMQECFLSNREKENRELLVQSQLEVLTYCAETDIPVIVVEYELPLPEKTIDCLLDKIQSVPRNRSTIKTTDNAMLSSRPNVRRILRSFEVDYLVLMGVNACSCVKSTASTCLKRGYKIATSGDVISDDIGYDFISLRDPPDDKIPIYGGGLVFYRTKCDFFNTHKDLIAHLEAGR